MFITKVGLIVFAICALAWGQEKSPCANPETQAFDFQVGVWRSSDGKRVHEITKLQRSCVVQEIWTGVEMYENAIGLKSFDDGKQKWFYTWTSAGFHQLWEGRKEEGQWRFYREWSLDGQQILSRTYWNHLDDGSLDRVVEQSRDGGKAWKVHVKDHFVREKSVATETTTHGFVEALIGEWFAKGKAFGMNADISMTWEPSLQSKFTKLTYTMWMYKEEKPVQRFEGCAFYKKRGDGSYEATWFDSGGEMHPIVAQFADNELTATWGTQATKLGKTIYRILSDTSVEVVDFIQRKDGTWKEFNRNTLFRK